MQATAKYIFLSPWPIKSGAGVNNVILALREAAAQYYWPILAVCGWHCPPDDQIWIPLRPPTASFKDLAGFLIYLIRDLARLRKFVRDAVAVNPHYIGLQLLPLAILRKLGLAPRLILSAHGSDITTALAASRLDRMLYRWLLEAADVVVACSQALASQARLVGPSANIVSVWSAVDHPDFISNARPLANPYLVCVAAFWRNKGHDILVQAFQAVSETCPNLHLVLIGGPGPDLEDVRSMLKARRLEEKTHVLVDLPHDEVWPWVKHAECLVLSSRNEALGLCILEAGVVGTPVVATRVGGIPELLGDNKRGLLCAPENPDELRTAIIQTLSNKTAAGQRAAALHEMVADLTWMNVFEKYQAAAGLK